VASILIEGNHDISTGLEWIRTWALHIAEADPDTECASVSIPTNFSLVDDRFLSYL
jgi:telomere length regulation protein